LQSGKFEIYSEAYTRLRDFVLEKLEVPDWPIDPMPKLPRMAAPPLPPDC
jgi:hypothetical protein